MYGYFMRKLPLGFPRFFSTFVGCFFRFWHDMLLVENSRKEVISMPTIPDLAPHDITCRMLFELGIPVHRAGYRQLCLAIPRFAQNKSQSLTKELYPYIAQTLGHSDWRAVEHARKRKQLVPWLSMRAMWRERKFTS